MSLLYISEDESDETGVKLIIIIFGNIGSIINLLIDTFSSFKLLTSIENWLIL